MLILIAFGEELEERLQLMHKPSTSLSSEDNRLSSRVRWIITFL